jgi:hypothetical protein
MLNVTKTGMLIIIIVGWLYAKYSIMYYNGMQTDVKIC